jgi:hypothetical protein
VSQLSVSLGRRLVASLCREACSAHRSGCGIDGVCRFEPPGAASLPCRRSWVRVPSSASQSPLETAGFYFPGRGFSPYGEPCGNAKGNAPGDSATLGSLRGVRWTHERHLQTEETKMVLATAKIGNFDRFWRTRLGSIGRPSISRSGRGDFECSPRLRSQSNDGANPLPHSGGRALRANESHSSDQRSAETNVCVW